MAKVGEGWRLDFEQAVGESFGDFVSPPVPEEDASPHECREVVRSVVGHDMTPTRLATLNEAQVATLAKQFGLYFDSNAPTVEQIKGAIAQTLFRWPFGSLGETA